MDEVVRRANLTGDDHGTLTRLGPLPPCPKNGTEVGAVAISKSDARAEPRLVEPATTSGLPAPGLIAARRDSVTQYHPSALALVRGAAPGTSVSALLGAAPSSSTPQSADTPLGPQMRVSRPPLQATSKMVYKLETERPALVLIGGAWGRDILFDLPNGGRSPPPGWTSNYDAWLELWNSAVPTPQKLTRFAALLRRKLLVILLTLEDVDSVMDVYFPRLDRSGLRDKISWLRYGLANASSGTLSVFLSTCASAFAKMSKGIRTAAACELLWLLFHFVTCKVSIDSLLNWPTHW